MARHRFNPNDEFTVAAGRLTVGRKTFRQGQKFDKSRVSRTKLRRLYERRSIVPVTAVARTRQAPATKPAEGTRPIPADWREMKWPQMRSLASSVSDQPVINKAEAVAALEAEEARRA